MDIILYIFKALKFENFEAQISLRDPNNKEKYIGSDENWHLAEQAIIEACAEKGLTPAPNWARLHSMAPSSTLWSKMLLAAAGSWVQFK